MSKGKRVREERRGEEPRGHHVVPQSYLSRFAEDGQLVAIQRDTGESIRTSVRKIARERDFYAIETQEGEKSQELERVLGMLESAAKASFDSILATPDRPPDTGDRIAIANFVAFQVVRGPGFRARNNKLADYVFKEFNIKALPREREALREHLRGYWGREPGGEELDELLDMIESPDRFEVRPHQNESIKIALEMAPKVLELLVPRTWNIIRFEEPVLVTSDEPVTMWNEPYPEQQFRGKGLANCDEIRLPLDPRHMLILTLGAKPFDLGLFGTMPADPWALELNATTAYFGHRWIFASPSHPALEQVRELARTTPRHGIQAHFGGQVTDIIATL